MQGWGDNTKARRSLSRQSNREKVLSIFCSAPLPSDWPRTFLPHGLWKLRNGKNSVFKLMMYTLNNNHLIQEKTMKVILVNGSPHEHGCTYTALTEIKNTLEHEAYR